MSGDAESSLSLDSHIVSSIDDIKTGLEWYQICPNGLDKIAPRVGHAMVPLPDGKVMLIGGSSHEEASEEIWNIDLRGRDHKNDAGDADCPVTKTVIKEGFQGRYEFLCVVGTQEEDGKLPKIWIFGGANSASTMNDVIYIENDGVIEPVSASGVPPSARTQGGNTTLLETKDDQLKSYLTVFAGGFRGEKPVPDGNLYLYDINEQAWMIVPTKSETPPVTQGHVMTSFGSKVFVHGGLQEMALFDGLHMIDIKNFTTQPAGNPESWILVDIGEEVSPEGRAAHGIARSPGDSPKSFYIFGGVGIRGTLNDLWRFDTESNKWDVVTDPKIEDGRKHPSPRCDFAMTSLRIRDKESGDERDFIIVHGGMNSKGEMFGDLWAMQI